MTYRVHLSSRGHVNSKFNCAESPHQWLTNEPEIVAEAQTLEDAEMIAYSHLGRDPFDTAYISSEDGRLHRTLRCDPADDQRSRFARRFELLFGFTMLCMIAFACSAIFGSPLICFAVFVLSASLFLFFAVTKIQNVTECMFVGVIIELLALASAYRI